MELEEYYEWFFDYQHTLEENRGSKWKELRGLFIKHHPTCAACGSTKKLQVHHCQPVSEGGSDDWNNLIVLCMGGRFKGLSCHFIIGHRGDWQLHNPFVREDATLMLDRLTKRRDREKY